MGGGKIVLSTLLLISFFSPARAQKADSTGRWYFGIQGGTAFGQCTFRSITTEDAKYGFIGGIFAGYGFSPAFSLEGAVNLGNTKLIAQQCDPFWLSDDGECYFAPVIDHTGEFYKNITAKTNLFKASLQFNIDLLKLFTEPCSKISLSIAPQISAVITKNKLTSDLINNKYDQQSHFGYGAQAAFGFFVAQKVQVQLFGGITCLTGDRIDNLPKHYHESNLIWDAGIKIAYRLRRTCGEKAIPPYTDNNPSNINDNNDDKTQVVVVDIPKADTTQQQQVITIEDIVNTGGDNNKQDTPPAVVVDNGDNSKPADQNTQPADSRGYLLPVINFADNGLTILPNEYPKFRQVAQYLNEHPDESISIYGYCSRPGTKEYNMYLSQRRADMIKRRLMAEGVAENRFKIVKGMGVDYDAPNNRTARRVEIYVNKK